MELIPALLAVCLVILLGGIVFLGFRKLGDMDSSAKLPEQALDHQAPEDDPALLQQLVAQGRTIEAIKRVRRNTGMGLQEAKAYVESLPKPSSLVTPDVKHASLEAGSDLEQEVGYLRSQRKKFEAIKRVREVTGCGLREAKAYVDALERRA